MIRVAMIFFDSDGNVASVCSVLADSNAPDDIAAAVRSQWFIAARCLAYWSPTDGADYSAAP